MLPYGHMQETGSQHTKKLIENSDIPVHFFVCRDAQGHIVHYVLRCNAQKLSLLMKNKAETVRPEAYGVVLASGFGYEPSQATRHMLKSEYGYDFKPQEGDILV